MVIYTTITKTSSFMPNRYIRVRKGDSLVLSIQSDISIKSYNEIYIFFTCLYSVYPCLTWLKS